MYPDREYRFALAVMHPMPELNEAGWHLAIQHAINDAHLAGRDPETDAGVRLLKLKSEMTKGTKVDASQTKKLTSSCRKRLAEIRAEPVLALLASHDIGSNQKLKNWFHAEARKALVSMADCAGIPQREYLLHHRLGQRYEPGSTYLVGEGFHIEVTAGRKLGANVGLYKTHDRDFLAGDKPQWRSLVQLLDSNAFGAWLIRQIDLMKNADALIDVGERLDRESALTQSYERTGQ